MVLPLDRHGLGVAARIPRMPVNTASDASESSASMLRERTQPDLLTIVAIAIASAAQQTNLSTSRISESALRSHIKFLSDDRLEGRGTGAKGGEIAALYIAEQFEAMGLKGAGAKGSFWQPVSLVGVKADPKTELRINGRERAEAFKFADDFVAFTGAQTDHVSVNADLVFVAFTEHIPPLATKVVVILEPDPQAKKDKK